MSSNGSSKITLRPTGEQKEPSPWHGPQFYTAADGSLAVSSTTLPSASMIFFPVFVISKDVTTDVIAYLIDSSRPAIDRLLQNALEDGEADQFDPRLILPPERDPKFLLGPTSIPAAGQSHVELPFLGYSLTDVFATWTGTDKASSENGVAPLRHIHGVVNKPRFWSANTFLVLDELTMANKDEPTALLAYLKDNSSNQEDIEYIRCDLPVSLRFMVLLEAGNGYNIQYFRQRLASEDGVVRNQVYEEWFKPGGTADQELERA